MRILGINDHITSGAAVIEDGRVLAAVNEERLVRKKMVIGFPWESIGAVLDITGLSPNEIDCIAVASKTGHFLDKYVSVDNGIFTLDEGFVKGLLFSVGAYAGFLRNRIPALEDIYYGVKQPIFAHRRREVPKVLREQYDFDCPVEFVSHHFAHAASAYYASDFSDALVVTLDGAGDGDCSHVYEVIDGKWEHLHSVPAFDSPGRFYAYVTHMCGFKAGKHEGKVTGLAAYGEPIYQDVFDRHIRYENGTIANLTGVFRQSAIKRLRAELPLDFRREDLAASIQAVLEDIAVRYISHWRERTGQRNIALAGGVVANVKLNQCIHEIDGVDSIFVYPAMSDEGLGAGAALALEAHRAEGATVPRRTAFNHVYLGPAFSESELLEALDAEGIESYRAENVETEIARLLAEGKVVARFAGRMEYGPRALGNRSILYRPDDPSVNDWLNARLRRTEFMPFAPATMAEDADWCYVGVDGARHAAHFMTITFGCTDEMKRACPGIVHVDGTARPQLVTASDNPSYYRIIQEFKRLTGLPSIINTSFNIHEEPIVCTPQDAVRAFLLGHLDVLAMGPFIAKHPKLDELQAETRHDSKLASPNG
jgi:carbamoyltransferase